ncbi:MAG: hypothetical protein V3V99_02570 [candidate division Zixibacteria bacterium]
MAIPYVPFVGIFIGAVLGLLYDFKTNPEENISGFSFTQLVIRDPFAILLFSFRRAGLPIIVLFISLIIKDGLIEWPHWNNLLVLMPGAVAGFYQSPLLFRIINLFIKFKKPKSHSYITKSLTDYVYRERKYLIQKAYELRRYEVMKVYGMPGDIGREKRKKARQLYELNKVHLAQRFGKDRIRKTNEFTEQLDLLFGHLGCVEFSKRMEDEIDFAWDGIERRSNSDPDEDSPKRRKLDD